MIDVALVNGDFMNDGSGDIMLEPDEDFDIIQMANSAINTIKGSNIFHGEYGNDAWNKRLKISESGFATVESCATDTILQADSRIEEVQEIEAIKGDEYGECRIKYTLLTIDGDTISSETSINIL